MNQLRNMLIGTGSMADFFWSEQRPTKWASRWLSAADGEFDADREAFASDAREIAVDWWASLKQEVDMLPENERARISEILVERDKSDQAGQLFLRFAQRD